jgi:hypothetical protein
LKPNDEVATLVKNEFKDFSTGLYSTNEQRLIYEKKGLKRQRKASSTGWEVLFVWGEYLFHNGKKNPKNCRWFTCRNCFSRNI